MQIHPHIRTTGTALKRWFIATTYDALAVGAMWLLGLLIIGVPWAPLWAFLGGAFQFIPNVGPIFALIGPAAMTIFIEHGMERFLYVLVLYAVIAVVDGLFLQPYFMKRTSKVPIWASIVTPIVLGILFNFWGVLISAPLLSVIYTFRSQQKLGAGKPAP
jgi:predicted PurR-regulated permease PerM